MQSLLPAISVFLVSLNAACAQSTPRHVVTQLYQKYSWEADPRSTDTDSIPLLNQPEAELARYFDANLVSLLIADRECARRSGEVCRLDWDPIWDSQDPAAEDLTIRSLRTNAVLVRFRHPYTGEERALEYHLVNTRAGWRISDIRYKNGVSLQKTLRADGAHWLQRPNKRVKLAGETILAILDRRVGSNDHLFAPVLACSLPSMR